MTGRPVDQRRNSGKQITTKKSTPGRIDSFTKLAVAVVLINACAWVWCSYILAYLGRFEIAESLSQTAVTAIIGTFITYAVKSAVENVNKNGVNLTVKKTEKKDNLKRDI